MTAVATGAVASWLLGLSLLEGMLLGSIVGSTDAAAVFAVLRGRGLQLSRRVSATLEVESASNDPMAVFLTVGLLEVLMGGLEPGLPMLGFFALQMGVGAIVGLAVGSGAARLVNRINLDAAGLYPLLVAACGLFAFGLAASLGGSGFLAVYLAGIVLGNSRIVFHRGILLFHDGTAWLSQIGMFVVLGLVSFPSRLVEAARPGLLVAVVLLLVARPLAVTLSLLPFRFRAAELAFISWAGLRGAVPIVLATYPLLRGLPNAGLLFDVVFFAVVVSVLTQGLTLPWAARKLGLEVPSEIRAPVTLEITSLKHVDSDIVDYAVGPDSRAAGRAVRALALPEVAVVAMIARGGDVIPRVDPRASSRGTTSSSSSGPRSVRRWTGSSRVGPPPSSGSPSWSSSRSRLPPPRATSRSSTASTWARPPGRRSRRSWHSGSMRPSSDPAHGSRPATSGSSSEGSRTAASNRWVSRFNPPPAPTGPDPGED